MLVYRCKQCKKFTIAGYINEYEEHFCSHKCYKFYCNIHGYEPHLEKLIPTTIIYNKNK